MKKFLLSIAMLSLLAVPVLAEDCVEVDIDIDPVLAPGEVYYFDASLTNCSDEVDIVFVTITFEYATCDLELVEIPVPMAPGDTFSRSLPFTLPDFAPSGDGHLCVTARVGEVVAEDCAYFTINNPNWGATLTPAKDLDSKDFREDSAIR